MKRSVFWVNSFNKSEHTYKACASALAQDIPCNILFTDMQSSDDSWIHIERAVREAPRGADHSVTWLKTPMPGVNTFASLSEHFMFAAKVSAEKFPESEYILQCSADDYSLPGRARVCMEAVEKHPCDAIATTMYFADPSVDWNGNLLPDGGISPSVSGYPTESGYVQAGEGIARLAYGSVIAGYSVEFLNRIGGFDVTPDVYYGYAAALGKGFYVVADPQHVHVQHSSEKNLGFGGKLLAAKGDELARLSELNHYQLFSLYRACLEIGQKIRPEGIPQEDLVPLLNMMLGQAIAWHDRRKDLHINHITPGVL
jgi:hypothetical protein